MTLFLSVKHTHTPLLLLGVDKMVPEQHAKFVDYHSSKILLHPDEPAHVIASLAINAPNSISGKFFSWDDKELVEHRKQKMREETRTLNMRA